MKDGHYLVGEFARLSHVPKDTLLYYDRIGLFSPAHVEKNGYRYYSHEQLYTIGFIHLFREIGTPLSEIRAYVDDATDEHFLEILRKSDAHLEQEIRRARQIRSVVLDAMSITSKTVASPTGTMVLEKMSRGYYIVSPDAYSHSDNEDWGFLEAFRELFDYCRGKNINHQFLLCEVVCENELERADYATAHLALKTYERVNDARMVIQPPGLYAVVYYGGGHVENQPAYKRLMDAIEDSDYVSVGPLFQMNSSPIAVDSTDSRMRAMIQVQPKS